MMSPLEAYIKKQNDWRMACSADAKIQEMPITSKQAQIVIESLECDLSPENLTCDGELTGRALQDKGIKLSNAYNEAINLKLRFERRESYG